MNLPFTNADCGAVFARHHRVVGPAALRLGFYADWAAPVAGIMAGVFLWRRLSPAADSRGGGTHGSFVS
ncbi:MAG: hypothetical protein RIQ93_2583 [Verrucomicrobiota bacterium]|jgi:hypothetical protein